MTVFHTALRTAALPLLAVLGACSSSTSQPAEPPRTATATYTTSPAAPAADAALPAGLQATLTANLLKLGHKATVTSISATEIPNLYWVTFEQMPPLYVTGDGRHVIQGEVMRLGAAQPVDISEPLVARSARQAFQAIPASDTVDFAPAGQPKATVYVFTDADCGYCRKLHSEITQINARGIEVRYLAWPRSPQTMPVMNAIWCSPDRKAAMTQAKQGIPVQAPACKTPVDQQQQLGLRLGVRGTPAIFTEQGVQIGGYLSPDNLAKALGL